MSTVIDWATGSLKDVLTAAIADSANLNSIWPLRQAVTDRILAQEALIESLRVQIALINAALDEEINPNTHYTDNSPEINAECPYRIVPHGISLSDHIILCMVAERSLTDELRVMDHATRKGHINLQIAEVTQEKQTLSDCIVALCRIKYEDQLRTAMDNFIRSNDITVFQSDVASSLRQVRGISNDNGEFKAILHNLNRRLDWLERFLDDQLRGKPEFVDIFQEIVPRSES